MGTKRPSARVGPTTTRFENGIVTRSAPPSRGGGRFGSSTRGSAAAAGRDIFIARQPILDPRQRTVAYELLFRSSAENRFPNVDGNYASSRILHDCLHVFGLDALAPMQRAYINVTRRVLVQELIRVLPPERVTVEILETVEPDDEVIAACQRLSKDGYLIALDDFVFRPGYEALVAVADIIKVDFTLTRGVERARVVERFGSPKVRFLAEKIETREEFEEASKLGYTLFQGYFFARPEIISTREIRPLKLNCLRLLNVVNERELDFARVEEIIRQEVSIAVKLLKQLNSAALRGRRQINSIHHALVLLGEVQFRRWMSLLALTEAGSEDTPAEVIVSSLSRARFCERVAALATATRPPLPSFLVGLLSMVDVLMGRPIEEILQGLAIDPDVECALLKRQGPLADLLTLAIAHERGEWATVTRLTTTLGIEEAWSAQIHLESAKWAQEVVRGSRGKDD